MHILVGGGGAEGSRREVGGEGVKKRGGKMSKNGAVNMVGKPEGRLK